MSVHTAANSPDFSSLSSAGVRSAMTDLKKIRGTITAIDAALRTRSRELQPTPDPTPFPTPTRNRPMTLSPDSYRNLLPESADNHKGTIDHQQRINVDVDVIVEAGNAHNRRGRRMTVTSGHPSTNSVSVIARMWSIGRSEVADRWFAHLKKSQRLFEDAALTFTILRSA
jgi:hypothetical protein